MSYKRVSALTPLTTTNEAIRRGNSSNSPKCKSRVRRAFEDTADTPEALPPLHGG
ncbi:hypothetical protein [uncultured Bacteroides sp.]|uniref:hypothetical protein n=1 Tax=uncultured Bacteroides sp. TaxID=162156 RepID=UPI0025E9572B|nr:hypothetical protein [uncultured Bacteroides sp.]